MDDKKPPPEQVEQALIKKLLEEHEKQAHTDRLTSVEIIALREILESNRRWKWVVSGLKTWAIWISALVAGSTVGLELLKTIVKTLGK